MISKQGNTLAQTTAVNSWAHFLPVLKKYWIALLCILLIGGLSKIMLSLSKAAQGDLKPQFIATQATTPQSVNWPEIGMNELLALPQDNWKKPQNLFFVDNKDVVWLKVVLPKSTAYNDTMLYFLDPLLDRAVVSVVRETPQGPVLEKTLVGGDASAFAHRDIELPNLAFLIPANKHPTTLYIAAKSQLAFNLNVAFWTPSAFLSFNDQFTILFGLLFGFMFALVCFGVVMFSVVKKRVYMWYCGYLMSYFSHVMATSNFGYQYFWPNLVDLQSVAGATTSCISYLLLLGFSKEILPPQIIWHKRVFNGLILANLAAILFAVVSTSEISVKICLLFIFTSNIVAPVLCALSYKQQKPLAILLSGVWLLLLLVTLTSVLERVNLLPFEVNPVFIVVVGFYCTTIIIGYVLLSAYKSSYDAAILDNLAASELKEKELSALVELEQIQTDTNEKLEQQVNQQTSDLQSALEDLHSAQEELKNMSKLDPLTALPNRLTFEQGLLAMEKRAINDAKTVSVALFDLDHFKQVNDVHGHKAGDDCLQAFARMLEQSFDKADYNICRFGGEEFVLSSLISPERVEQQLQTFISELANQDIATQTSSIRITTSVGMVSKRIFKENTAQNLLSIADENLYKAKSNGRNQIVAST